MLLHGVLKWYVLYVLFDYCAAVNHQRISNIDERVRSARRSLELLDDEIEKKDNNLESDKPDIDVELDDAKNENDGNDKQQSDLKTDQISKKKQGGESVETAEIKEDEKITPKLDLTDSSADKILEINKLSAMNGFDYSPTELEKFKIWPQGIIPFYIDEFSFDKIVRDKIREQLDEASSMTGLRFLELPRPPADDSTRWVFFINRRGQLECTDYTPNSFNNTGVQKVVIGYDCVDSAKYIAPIVLALAGVPPQHNSPDRDEYIDVSTKSIQPDKVEMFTAVKPVDWLFHDIKYDFLSAGHYPSHKYTVDGTATIVPKSKISTLIGETEGLSYTDVVKIRMLYNLIVEKDDKNAKLPDCKALYHPGPKFKMIDVVDQNSLPARKKPQKYIEAAKQAGIEIVEGSENTPSAPDSDNTDKKNSENSKSNKNNDEGSDSGQHVNNDDDNDKLNDDDNDKSNNKTDEIKENLNENNNNSNDVHNNDNSENEKGLGQTMGSSKEILKDSRTSTTNPMTLPDNVTSEEKKK